MFDSTTLADSLEVVAMAAEPRNATLAAPASPAAADSMTRLRILDDSSASLDARFRELRDALSTEIASLDTMDRRARTYTSRYDAIVRRTKDAEQLRAARDSIRARAELLRARLGPRAAAAPGAAAENPPSKSGEQQTERRQANGASLKLSLSPGSWWIGIARAGTDPVRYDSLTIRTGATDTVDLRSSTPRPDPR